MITPDNLVSREVHYCVSYLVSTLASGYGAAIPGEPGDLADMIEQAFELACPIDDWEEAARQAGWSLGGYAAGGADGTESWEGWYRLDDTADDGMARCGTAQEACEHDDIDPYQWEVFEHWIVSDWLADKLAEHGEKVDKDFAGMIVWARTTSGQGIASDSVIEAICAELNVGA